MKKSIFFGLILTALSFGVKAAPISVSGLDDFVMASGSSIGLGSEAHLYSSVGSDFYISMGSGVVVEGAACSPALGIGAGAVIKQPGTTCPAGNYFKAQIAQISQQASGWADASAAFDVTNTTALAAGNYTLSSLHLDAGESLTISGKASDVAIINITGLAKLGSGAAIYLKGGISAQTVFFNFIDNAVARSFEFGGAELSGTFLSSSRDYIMGDGATLQDSRFFTNGAIVANVQDVIYRGVTEVSAPATGLLALTGVAGLLMRRRIKPQVSYSL